MPDMVYSVKIKFEQAIIHDDCDWLGQGEIYFRGKVGPHSTGRSPIFKAGSGTTIDLTGQKWEWEFVVNGVMTIPIGMESWDEDLIWDDPLGKVQEVVKAPWEVKQYTAKSSSGKFSLVWSVANTTLLPAKVGIGFVSRQYDGSNYVSTLAVPLVGLVEITDVLGLNKPGVDDRAVKPPGTTKNSSYVAGYRSEDDRGRIFTNRKPDGTWTKNVQFVDITAEVFPVGLVLPAGSKMIWTVEDPDDPTNEDPKVTKEAGKILDPNDYTGDVKTAAKDKDNDPNSKAKEKMKLAEVDPKYALSGGNETLIDIPTRISKVRLHVDDVAGANYRVTAGVKPHPAITLILPGSTGIMTVWHRIEVEYVKMDSANELPVDEISKHYDMACAQVDVSLKRVVTGAADKASMGPDDGSAYAACEKFATKPPPPPPPPAVAPPIETSLRQFTMAGQKGWFFIAAASRYMPAKSATIVFEGDAEAFANKVRLPVGLASKPAVVRVFNAAKIVGMPAPKPNDYDLHIKFPVEDFDPADPTKKTLILKTSHVEGHDFHEVDSPSVAFLRADLSHYGFAAGATIPVQVLSNGDEAMVTAGISPGGVGDHFGGKLLVFTKVSPASQYILTLCHELCHAFDNAHKCGNWDWIKQPDKTACCMNYWFQFILDDGMPRKPILWTQHRTSAEMCARHIRNIRDFHLEDNPGLGW